LLHLVSLDVDVGTDHCRATTGDGRCVMSVLVRTAARG
jgi:hypothetical protein